jgi:cysteine-rich repeat protein
VQILFPTPELRAKPELVAPDGVSVTGNGGFPSSFFGTSAAAPHAAAVAALVLDRQPSLTPGQLRIALIDGALDLGPPGADDTYGAGRIDALAAVNILACGNGTLDLDEECDDGNASDGDGCTRGCEVETCFVCAGAPSLCSPDGGRPCEDGDACTGGDTCGGGACLAGPPITTCTNGDGCCPDGCAAMTDDDCLVPVPAMSPLGWGLLVALLAAGMLIVGRRRWLIQTGST